MTSAVWRILPYSAAALTCRVCGGMIVADEAPRIDVVLELSPAAAAWRATAKTRPASRRALRARLNVIAISAEPREGSEQLQADWKLERLPIAYELTEPSMREWGLMRPGYFAHPGSRQRI
jgi:hypothetical protein